MSNKITMPWEERPAGCKDVMWRYSENPVIDRYHIPSSNSIFNSAVVPFKDGADEYLCRFQQGRHPLGNRA